MIAFMKAKPPALYKESCKVTAKTPYEKAHQYLFWTKEYRLRRFYETDEGREAQGKIATLKKEAVDIFASSHGTRFPDITSSGDYETSFEKARQILDDECPLILGDAPDWYCEFLSKMLRIESATEEYFDILSFPDLKKTNADDIIKGIKSGKFSFSTPDRLMDELFPSRFRVSTFYPSERDDGVSAFVRISGRINLHEDAREIFLRLYRYIQDARIQRGVTRWPGADEEEQVMRDLLSHVVESHAGIDTVYMATNQGRSDPGRAIGLWLWDYTIQHSCTVTAAIQELRKNNLDSRLGFAQGSSDKIFERHYALAKKCITFGIISDVGPVEL